MKRFCFVLLGLCLGFMVNPGVYAQEKLHFLERPDSLDTKRLLFVSGTLGSSYTATMIGLNSLWYKDYPRTSFHFHNDLDTWLQMDKIGHSWTAYVEGEVCMELLRWTGMKDKQAIWIGGSMGSLFQGTIEWLDGYSQEWGASAYDLLANSAGTAMLIAQELHWKEQRMRLKWSFRRVDYDDREPALVERTDDLFSRQYQQMILKNYNGQSYWLSVNPSSFIKRQNSFPKWLNIAGGYGIEDVFGGSDNIWENDAGQVVDYSHIDRKREYYLSLDIDFKRIETNSRFLRMIFGALNVFKVPAPALSYRSDGRLKAHLLYW